jgi:hypothetical protein
MRSCSAAEIKIQNDISQVICNTFSVPTIEAIIHLRETYRPCERCIFKFSAT